MEVLDVTRTVQTLSDLTRVLAGRDTPLIQMVTRVQVRSTVTVLNIVGFGIYIYIYRFMFIKCVDMYYSDKNN